ncbi:MAG: hypothetical protein LC677_05880 [Halomonas sp.]|nr:hypothetical protein [Halomonas sp.]
MSLPSFSWRSLTFVLLGALPVSSAVWAQSSADNDSSLDTVTVTGEATAYGDTPPPAFAGGQAAAGGRVGLLGEQDAMDVPYNVIS